MTDWAVAHENSEKSQTRLNNLVLGAVRAVRASCALGEGEAGLTGAAAKREKASVGGDAPDYSELAQ